ncbi:MAG: PIN domain-containing protein [Candidatus Micrarchaeota archaeon]
MTANSETHNLLVDSFAWLEYFKSTPRGELTKKYLDNSKYQLFTLDAGVGEVKFSAERAGESFDPIFKDIARMSTIVSSDVLDWLSAAQIKFEKRKNTPDIGIIDCLIIHHSHKLSAKILTGDNHFKNEKNAILI